MSLDEKKDTVSTEPLEAADVEVLPPASDSVSDSDKNHTDVFNGEEHIIRTATDVSNYLLSDRDDGDPALTFRSAVIGTLMVGFSASMDQISNFKTSGVTLSTTLMIFIVWILGNAWTLLLPRGDKLQARWRDKGNPDGHLPWWLRLALFVNPGPFGLKEHAVAAITASSASNGSASISVFTVQKLFYQDHVALSATTIVLSTLSIGLFGYGLTGVLRPITVWAVESVYWANLPIVSMLQTMHWYHLKDSKVYRRFWYCAAGTFIYEWIPQYMFPWLHAVSVPCLAAINATGNVAKNVTNIFGGSLSNEGLGILNWTFDWNDIGSGNTSLPLKYQANTFAGYLGSIIIAVAIYYGNAWNAKNYPFIASTLRRDDGSRYDPMKVFDKGVLNVQKLREYGIPHLAGTYAMNMTLANMALGGLFAHVIFFWGRDIIKTVKTSRAGKSEDRHHAVMVANYKEAPMWWYLVVLVIAFVFGLAVTIREKITLPVWAYIIALIVGAVVAPFSTILFARFGNGIATNNLMKMIAGGIIPGRPLGLLYFSAWSHSVISQSLNLASDLKLGEYLKIPPRIMFLTQIWGTALGAFVNYGVMTGIVREHWDLLANGDGNYVWTGVVFQSSNTVATSWALAKYMFSRNSEYFIVSLGVVIGFGVVALHRIFAQFVPRIGSLHTHEINLPTIIQNFGFVATGTNTGTLTVFAAGFYIQYYIRNWKPKWYKRYAYLLPVGLDLGNVVVGFILAFAVFGVARAEVPFPNWWGNPDGRPDHCPVE